MTPRPKKQGIAKMLQLRTLVIVGGALLAGIGLGHTPASAAESGTGASNVYSAGPVSRSVKVGLNKSLVIDLPRDARDILVSNPIIADAVIRTPRRIYVTGIAIGQSNVIVFDRAGQQIVALELEVERDSSTLTSMLRRLIPDSDINVEIVSDNIVLSGSVKNASDGRKAQDIANIFANGGSQAIQGQGGVGVSAGVSVSGQPQPTSSVVNMLTIQGEDQVQVRVSIAEVQRSLVKQLGIDWNATNLNIAGLLMQAATELPFAVRGTPDSNASLGSNSVGPVPPNNGLSATIRALEQANLFKTLAEPTLTAISGESASFLAGGEFPVPTGRDQDGNPIITFKPFGVALAMTPVVLSDGRISLRVKTEVSELSQEGALTIGDVTFPSLKVRRAETTLELPSGGSMVLGGLLQDSVRQSISALPGIGQLPVLGALFRSRDFQRNETELVIIATPYLVKPVSRSALATPDQGYATPGDGQTIFFGKLNRVYGSGKTAGQKYQGQAGYIYE
jgi:pilus assembly protein CpaC